MDSQSQPEPQEEEVAIDEDEIDDGEDDQARAQQLLGEKWVAEDQCRWTIFEDLEDELVYHRRRSRALCCFVRAYGELREEYDQLQEGGLQLQDAYEQLQEELREAIGDSAYWKELAEARAEITGGTLTGPPRPTTNEPEGGVVGEMENEIEVAVQPEAEVEVEAEQTTAKEDVEDDIVHVGKEGSNAREVLHCEMLKDAQEQVKKWRRLAETREEENVRLRRHLAHNSSPSSPRADSAERGVSGAASQRPRLGSLSVSSITGLTRGLSPFARASVQTPPRSRTSAIGLNEQLTQRQAWQSAPRTPKSPATNSAHCSPGHAGDRTPTREPDDESSRFPCAAVAGLAASTAPSANAQTNRRILFSASSPGGSQATSVGKTSVNEKSTSSSSLPVRTVPTPARGAFGLGTRPCLGLGTPSRRKEPKQESTTAVQEQQRQCGSPSATDLASSTIEPSRASIASRSRPSMSPGRGRASSGRASLTSARRLTMGLGQPTRRSTIPNSRSGPATAREDSPSPPAAQVPFRFRSSTHLNGSSEASVGSQEFSVGETSVGSQEDSVGAPRRGGSELGNPWDAKRLGAESRRSYQQLNLTDRRVSTSFTGAHRA